jgi:uncharacterized protein (TIGR02117 family)
MARRAAYHLLLAPIFAVLIWIAVALVLGTWRIESAAPTTNTPHVTIYVVSNGYHTSLILPISAVGIDWRERVPIGDARADITTATHVMFGWGDRDVYMNTPRLSDLRPMPALRALFGLGEGVMHVVYLGSPPRDGDIRTVIIDPQQYRYLAAFVWDSFRRDDRDAPMIHPGRGLGYGDAFFASTYRYNFYLTCNEWTGMALRIAKIPTGAWTPFEHQVMMHLNK